MALLNLSSAIASSNGGKKHLLLVLLIILLGSGSGDILYNRQIVEQTYRILIGTGITKKVWLTYNSNNLPVVADKETGTVLIKL